ncbi:MAG TPA: hypothetical protein VFG21_10090 [Xanthomonadaceae bacterium]|nr:hypothetical protein [Xanthomonadaceae bacterium]
MCRASCSIALSVVLAVSAGALRAHEGGTGGAGETPEYWIGPGVSGSWYDPGRSGEGFVVQLLPDGRAFAIWFTYPPVGEAGDQAWLLAIDGRIDGDTIEFPQVLRPHGASFGDDFDPAQVQYEQWGTLQFHFQDCGHMSASWSGPPAWGSGTVELTRLTDLDELDCSGERALTATGARSLDGLRMHSGAWYVPSRSGEGWMIEELGEDRAAVYWFTFDPQGNQAWTIGVGTLVEGVYVIPQALIADGARFGADFDSSDVRLRPWGSQHFAFTACDALAMAYAASEPGYGAGAREGARLTRLASSACIDQVPTDPESTAWAELAAMPAPPQSEHAAAVLDGRLYALGGFGDERGFKRYDRAANAWSELPDLPAGRDHLAAFAVDGGIYMVGGAPNGGGDQSRSAYRYDVTGASWEPVDELGFMYGSHAAVVNGRAYIGNTDGSLQEFDPRARRVRRIAGLGDTLRDHSQVVAFLGEVWMLGGRTPETNSVAIYDPVGERWRSGPAFARPRAGFAAAVVGERIMIGGGELVSGRAAELEPTVEIYTAGAERWRFGPNLPVAVHGVPGAALDGRFVVVSGSALAGQEAGATGRVFELTIEP